MARSKDLFDESTMTFGEHLEALRLHLFKAILGLVVATLLTVYYGTSIVDMIRRPLDAALKRNKLYNEEEVTDYWSQFKGWLTSKPADSQSGRKTGIRKLRRPSRRTRRRSSFTLNPPMFSASCTAPTRSDTRLLRRTRTKRPFRCRSPRMNSATSGKRPWPRTIRSRSRCRKPS